MKYILSLLLICFSALSYAADPIHFGLIKAAGNNTLEEIWLPILEDLGKTLRRPVIPVQFEDYGSGVWYYNSGKVDIGWSGNRMAIELVDNAQAEIFLQSLNPQGQAGYYSHLIVHEESAYMSERDVFADADNITFGFGDRKSTSGTLVPMYYLFTKHDRSHFMFNRIKHSNHEHNFHAVVEKQFQAATISSEMLARFARRYPEKATQIRSVWSSPLIPTDPLLKRKDLPEETTKAISRFFLQYGKPSSTKSNDKLAKERAILKQINWFGFQPSDNSQLITVRQLNLANRIRSVENDPNITEAMKKARVRVLKEKLKLYQ